jgi:hypothetical protein
MARRRLGRREKQDVGYWTIIASQSMVCNLKSGILFLTPSLTRLFTNNFVRFAVFFVRFPHLSFLPTQQHVYICASKEKNRGIKAIEWLEPLKLPPTRPFIKTHQFWRGDINSIGQEAARFSMENERFFFVIRGSILLAKPGKRSKKQGAATSPPILSASPPILSAWATLNIEIIGLGLFLCIKLLTRS